MPIGRGRRPWLLCGLLSVVAITFAADLGQAQRFDYVITFDKVVVDGIGGTADTPDLAHLDLPTTTIQSEQPGADRLSPPAERKPDQAKQGEPPDRSFPKPAPRYPDPQIALPSTPQISFPPGQRLGNPSFLQEGFLVEAFWAVKTGTSEAHFRRAHFHPADLSSGFEAQHLGHPNELHGLFIQSVDKKRFGLKSLQYRVTRNRQIPYKAVSIEGFSNFNVSVLIGRSYDPRAPIRSQFVTFPVGLPMGNETSLPWFTLRIFGFELADQIYVASSASVDFDNIVLTRSEPPPALLPRKEEDK